MFESFVLREFRCVCTCVLDQLGPCDDLFTAAVDRGAWMCHRCAASGSWYDLKRRAGTGGARLVSKAVLPPTASGTRNAPTARRASGGEILVAQQRGAPLRPIPDQRRVGTYPVNLFHNPRFRKVKEYLTGSGPGQRGIEERVLMMYGVGCAAYR